MTLAIKNGRVVDPANNVDRVIDLYISEGRIAAFGDPPQDAEIRDVIDATDRVVCPGLVDLCARLREPGQEHKGTIASETRAAAAGGITTICCPPDTDPVIDEAAVVEIIHRRSTDAGFSRVVPLAALTAGLNGSYLSELSTLKAAGCVGASNSDRPVTDNHVMRRALEYAATYDITVFLQPQDPWLASQGCAHEGAVAARLGLAGIPVAAETVALAGLLELVAQTASRAHFGRLSAGRSLQMIGQAKAEGLPVSADVSINHLHLTEVDLLDFNAYCHVRPPLRAQEDREALRQALVDGTVDAVCSDHQPHEPDAKLLPFPSTDAGASGLETLLPLMLHLVDEGVLKLVDALGLVTHRPAQILGLDTGNLSPEARADVCIFDPNMCWTVAPDRLYSAGKNTPFGGWNLRGKVTHLLLDGQPLTWHGADKAT